MGDEKKNLWSHDVETKWHPPDGFFEQHPEDIAKGLRKVSDSLAQAMDRLDFYMNRAGVKLTNEAKSRLEAVKPLLRELFEK